MSLLPCNACCCCREEEGMKNMKPLLSNPRSLLPAAAIDWCDVTVKCRCRWRWASSSDGGGLCFFKCHKLLLQLLRACGGRLSSSSTFLFFCWSLLLFTLLGMSFAWLAFPPFQHHPLHGEGIAGCQPDNEGSWSIGVYHGANPFSLQPIETENVQSDKGAAWPVANPVFTCASMLDRTHPSNFVADPFLYIQGGKMYMFFELKNSITKQGDIGVAESSDNGATWRHVGIALDEEWHLSYPFVFEYDGEIYMMPEGSKKGDLRLYKALDFPLEWKLEKVLIHKPLVDASIVEYKGQYWIFASDFSRFGAQKNGELEIWFAPTPLGPWHQHRGNPVVNGNKSLGARSGGRPFVWEGKLYRFGQDCGDSYGRRLRAFHVITLTKDEFWEVEVPLGIEESKKGRNAWNGLRYHHMDVQQLPSGNWIAVMDGDRVPSSDLLIKYTIGSAALLVLLALNILVGVLFGCVRFVFPAGCIQPSKRSDTLLPHIHLQLIPRIYKTLNRSSPILRGRMWLRLCMGFLLLLFVFILCVCAVSMVVKCFFGGNGAEEPYPYKGQFSQFTMIAMTHEARLWNLKMYIKHYSRCASVREIVVVWNIGQPADPVTEFDSAVPVRIRVEPENSLNNRFKPDPLIKTRAVFELDDDIMMTCDDVERGFKAWRENSDRLVGFYPRLIDGNPLKYRDERYARHRKGYNMILTGAAFINSELTFSRYWSKEMYTGRALVDELFNCEDILMNFILANSTTSGHTVEYVHPAWAVDTSKLSSSAISRNTRGHYSKRTHCLLRFSQLYGGIPLKKWEFNSRNDGWDS